MALVWRGVDENSCSLVSKTCCVFIILYLIVRCKSIERYFRLIRFLHELFFVSLHYVFVILFFRFLELYPLNVGDKEMSLPLDETAIILGTERRRIYDIVNVLESLHFSVRVSSAPTWLKFFF